MFCCVPMHLSTVCIPHAHSNIYGEKATLVALPSQSLRVNLCSVVLLYDTSATKKAEPRRTFIFRLSQTSAPLLLHTHCSKRKKKKTFSLALAEHNRFNLHNTAVHHKKRIKKHTHKKRPRHTHLQYEARLSPGKPKLG